MSKLPFNVAGHLAMAIRQGGGSYDVPSPLIETVPIRATGSRRRRLWELPHKLHCPVVGVCFSCDELRGLMRKVMQFPPESTDFVLHTTAVSVCEQRSRLAELLHKELEARYRRNVKMLSTIRTNTELRGVWLRTCAEGADIPGTLWACWTHPALDAALEQEIFGDIHMLQHQLGSGTRADLRAMHALRDDNAGLRRQLDAAYAALEQLRATLATTTRSTERGMAEVRAELAAAEARGERFARELTCLRDELPALKDRQALSQRAAVLEAQAESSRQRVSQLERENTRLREFARYAEETIEALGKDAEELPEELPERDLSGKRVLCVGGRSGSLQSYRAVIEQSGGQFLHHDGGLEESLHRIDNVVAAADIVICQAGCISHNAYWRVKEHCKRTGKPCMFVKNAGVSSFDRAVDTAGRAQGVSPVSSDSPMPKSR